MSDPDPDISYGQTAYEAFMAPYGSDWDNAPNQRRWHRVGAAVIAAHKAACEPPSPLGPPSYESAIPDESDQHKAVATAECKTTGRFSNQPTNHV